ncbi:MAG: hypothetical protein Q4G05_01520 [Clostridia bacterium]|nr:hypothetical protein [Clostridia bacterium]
MKKNKAGLLATKTIIVLMAIFLVLFFLIKYICVFPFSIFSIDFWLTITVIAGLILILLVLTFLIEGYDCKGNLSFIKDFLKVFGIIVILLAAVVVIGGISSLELFNAKDYQQLVTIEESNFEKDIPNVSENFKQLSIVDQKTAIKLGDRTIGGLKNSTWYEVDDEYNLIKYQGKYYRISELNYGGFFKYNKAKKEGIPGYVLVDVTNQKAEYVELKTPIYYSPSGYFSKYLDRHIQQEYTTYILGESFFEIDEEGNPYYITSVQTPTIGLFGGKKENSFIITNASTGEMKEYKTEDLPEWVDHAYDLEYLMKVTEYNLKYVNGFWNTIFEKTGVNATSYNYETSYYNTAINNKGEIVFYTGVTPINKSESNLGFILANPRTGKISYYNYPGAEETSAQDAAESLVQNLGFDATFPTIINVEGQATYYMLLKDKAGLVQRVSLCNVEDYTKVVQAKSLSETISLYKEKIGLEVETQKEILTKTGKIESIYPIELEGFTYYYFTLKNDDNLYMSSIKNNNKQVFLAKDVEVSIEYTESKIKGECLVNKIKF